MIGMIQPSYGNPAARRHWRDTLDQPVPFRSPHTETPSPPSNLSRFSSFTRTAQAAFWGTTRAQDSKMAEVQRGDVVLLPVKTMSRASAKSGTFSITKSLPTPCGRQTQ
jgi:hypothetical protein